MPRGKKSLSSLQQQGDRQWGGPSLAGGVLTPALSEFCQSGTSIVLASCDQDGRPVVGRGLACRIEADGKARVVLRKSSNPKLLKALADGARFAVTFTQPSTHRSIQLKAPAARIVDANVGDAPAAIAQTTAFRRDLMDVGYSENFANTYCGFEPHDLVTLTFLPEHAFVQTPGPQCRERPAMSGIALDAIRGCLEGFVPAVMATCDAKGVPNVSMISQVHYVDPDHVALSYQFFNKTRQNILSTRAATISVVDPANMADYRLDLDYEETLTAGPIFESMRAKLAGIASHSGMEGVFLLRGADIMRVRVITETPGPRIAATTSSLSLLAAVRRSLAFMAAAQDLGNLFDRTLESLTNQFGIRHAMVLMFEESTGSLYTVGSTGYARSGVGSELAVGHGIIGVAARERVPIRIGHMSADYSYGAAIRDQAQQHGLADSSVKEIDYPGLAAPESQIAVPILADSRLLGVLFAESPEPMRFCYEDEDALTIVADRLADLIGNVQQEDSGPAVLPESPPQTAPVSRAPITIRHYAADDSVFLDHDYLIKGVAGAIFWKLARAHVGQGRVEFTNRELRLDPALRLPEHSENLEARLVLLQKRLSERSIIRIEKCGRGRFRFAVPCALTLEEVGTGA